MPIARECLVDSRSSEGGHAVGVVGDTANGCTRGRSLHACRRQENPDVGSDFTMKSLGRGVGRPVG
jgi:hypothetical protein